MTDGPRLACRVYDRVAAHLVGRERELLSRARGGGRGRDIILEGPPGTGESTTAAGHHGRVGHPAVVFVEGNADLTPSKLIGHHNPARVLREDYSAGQLRRPGRWCRRCATGRLPLHRGVQPGAGGHAQHAADRDGGTAGRGAHAGIVTAAPTFRVVASMNPYDNVGTARLSSVGARPHLPAWPSATRTRRPSAASWPCGRRCLRSPRAVPAAGRRRRGRHPGHPRAPGHPAGQQACAEPSTSPWSRGSCWSLRGPADYPELVYDAMVVALSGRIFLDETVEATPEAVLRQIWRTGSSWLRPPAAPG